MDYDYQIAYMKLKDAVKKMRQAQKEYFRTRDRKQLMISKDYERKVDEILDPPAAKERTLFDLTQ